MISKQAFAFRALLSVAALAAAGMMSVPAQAQLLGGSATGGLGGTLSPRQIDANGQLRAKAQLPRAEQLRETAGQTSTQATAQATQAAVQSRGNVDAAADKAVQLQGAATAKALQTQGMATATAATTAKDGADKATRIASANGSVSVKPEDGGVNASASGQAQASR